MSSNISKANLTQAELKGNLHYDPLAGVFTNIKKKSGIAVGQRAGWLHNRGYRYIKINQITYRTARLAFLYMTGAFPLHQTDHINKIRDDDRWANLQDITNKENCRKKGMNKSNKSGFNGVHFVKKLNKWKAGICVDGKLIYLGIHKELADAIAARKEANIKHGFDENHGATS